MPFELLKDWLEEEKRGGAPNPQQAVLSTATLQAVPRSRVVAIREFSEQGFLFFTQRLSRKVKELEKNPKACLVFWLEIQQREVIIEGMVEALSPDENENYWKNYAREAQARFSAYAPTSGQVISSKKVLEDKKIQILNDYANEEIPFSSHYCGFRLKAEHFIFYAYRLDELSDVYEYNFSNNVWNRQRLSP